MSRWLDIARKAREHPAPHTGTQQEPLKRGGEKQERGFLLVSNGCRAESEENNDAPHLPQQQPPEGGPVLDKVGVGGRPVTWTGKVVSLDDWRNLTEWERHGPNGRLWNGKTQQWEQAK